MLVPVNTRFKGAEAADILARSGAKVLVTVTDFLGTDYVAMLDDARRRAARPRRPIVVARRARAAPAPWRGPTSSAGPTDEARAEVDRRAARRQPRRPVRHPLHLGHHRRAQGRGADPRPHAARGHRLGGDDRPRRRRPLPDGQPVLPHVRAEGRDPRRRSRPARRCSPSRCSTSTGCWPGSPTSGSPCCPARRRSTSRSSTTRTATGTTCRACGSR